MFLCVGSLRGAVHPSVLAEPLLALLGLNLQPWLSGTSSTTSLRFSLSGLPCGSSEDALRKKMSSEQSVKALKDVISEALGHFCHTSPGLLVSVYSGSEWSEVG